MKVKAKKLTALVLAVVCAMALGMTAFAAGSPSAGSVGSSAASATDKNGNAVEVTFGSSSVAAPSGADLQKLLCDVLRRRHGSAQRYGCVCSGWNCLPCKRSHSTYPALRLTLM